MLNCEKIDWIENAKTEPEKFINNFMNSNGGSDEVMEAFRTTFKCGYCYYFATILKTAFNRGEICWTAPFGHFVWVDVDGIAYDIEGMYDMCSHEAYYLIPEKYIEEFVGDFLHNGMKSKEASADDLIKAVKKYCEENNETYYADIEKCFGR